MNNESFVTTSSNQTNKLGQILAKKLRGGEIICLTGDLGAGKTTFTQGLLKGLKVKGPYTSPTFAIIKHYKLKARVRKIEAVYHIDAYRVSSKDIFDLGFKDFAEKPNSIVVIEWAEIIKKLIPAYALWINFKWINNKERKISFGKKAIDNLQ